MIKVGNGLVNYYAPEYNLDYGVRGLDIEPKLAGCTFTLTTGDGGLYDPKTSKEYKSITIKSGESVGWDESWYDPDYPLYYGQTGKTITMEQGGSTNVKVWIKQFGIPIGYAVIKCYDTTDANSISGSVYAAEVQFCVIPTIAKIPVSFLILIGLVALITIPVVKKIRSHKQKLA